MNELKPCPFCGQAPGIVPYGGLKPGAYVIRCGNEECPVNAYTIAAPLDDAAKIWNHRAGRTHSTEQKCRNVSRYGFFECSGCGASIVADSCGEFSPDIWVENGQLNYCPNCGRVVEP